MTQPICETGRLRVRHFEPADLDDFAAVCADPLVMRYVGDGSPLPRSEVERWIEVCQNQCADRGYGTSAVFEKATGRFVGYCGVARALGNDFDKLVHVYHIDAWGTGHATEAATGMLAASVRVIEYSRAWNSSRGGGPVIVSGISMDGWVTNLHRSFFNSADAYAPLLAGAALDHVFVPSVYRVLTAGSALDNTPALQSVLNFEAEFARVPEDNVFPMLARHDEIIVFHRQKPCYGGRSVVMLEKGHVTAALATRDLRQHLLGVLIERRRGRSRGQVE